MDALRCAILLLVVALVSGCVAPASLDADGDPGTENATAATNGMTLEPAREASPNANVTADPGNSTGHETIDGPPGNQTTVPEPAGNQTTQTSSETAEPEPEPTPSDDPTSSSSTSTSSSTSSPPPPPAPDAGALVLVDTDLGSGWFSDPNENGPGQAPNAVDYARGYSWRYSDTPSSLTTTVHVFAAQANARAYFDSIRQELQGAPLQDVEAGDEAFVWIQSPGHWEEGWVLEATVVWELGASGPGGTASPTTAALLQLAAGKL